MSNEAYMSWLRDWVQEQCNKDGLYEVEWYPGDSLSPDTLLAAFRDYEGEGYVSPRAYLESGTLLSIEFEDYLIDRLIEDIENAPEEVQTAWEKSLSTLSDLIDAGYQGVDVNLDELLRYSSFNVNVFFATEQEEDYDMGSIVAAFGNDYRYPDLELLPEDSLDNALSYLVNQQGYTVRDLYGELLLGEASESKFLQSVCGEINGNSSNAMSELACLLRMNGQQMLDFLDQYERSQDAIVLPKDCATIGIFNEWSGCGGGLDIRLEKDAVIPMSMVRHFQLEDSTLNYSWTVDQTYGLVGECWKEAFSFSQEPVFDRVHEDYGRTLDSVRESWRERKEAAYASLLEKSTPSLADRCNSAKEASQGLNNHGTKDEQYHGIDER